VTFTVSATDNGTTVRVHVDTARGAFTEASAFTGRGMASVRVTDDSNGEVWTAADYARVFSEIADAPRP
jgi:hypothetical protein